MSEEKKSTPSTNIPLLSYRKSEQKENSLFVFKYFLSNLGHLQVIAVAKRHIKKKRRLVSTLIE